MDEIVKAASLGRSLVICWYSSGSGIPTSTPRNLLEHLLTSQPACLWRERGGKKRKSDFRKDVSLPLIRTQPLRTVNGGRTPTFLGSTVCRLWALKILFTPVWGRDGLSRHKINMIVTENDIRSSKRTGSWGWNAIWSRSFKDRKDVRQDVDSENLLTCYLLH